MKIGAYLHNIGQKVVACRPGDTAMEVAAKMREYHIGAMPVVGDLDKLVGVISERDLIRRFSIHGADLVGMKVESMLTKSVIFMGPNAELTDAMKAMRTHGFRHVPIVSHGEVIGMISIRDVLADAVDCASADHMNPALAIAAR